MDSVFTIEKLRPIRPGMTISRDSHLGENAKVTFFSLGEGTDISQESYDRMTLYIVAAGNGKAILGEDARCLSLFPQALFLVPEGMLCGMEAGSGTVYTEVILEEKAQEKIVLNEKIKAGEVTDPKKLLDYTQQTVSEQTLVKSRAVTYGLFALDAGCAFRGQAEGNALLSVLEGRTKIRCEEKEYFLQTGECFRIEKGSAYEILAEEKSKVTMLSVIPDFAGSRKS